MVTSVAEKKCRAAIHQAHRLNPDARIAVIGCLAELKAGELQDMESVDLVWITGQNTTCWTSLRN